MNGMEGECGFPTKDGRGPPCRNPVRGPWHCHIHGGPSAEEAERLVRDHCRAWLEQQVREAENEISQEALNRRIEDIDHKLVYTEKELESERSQREQNEQTISRLEFNIQRLEDEVRILQVERRKDELQIRRNESRSNWRENLNQITELVTHIEPYIVALKQITDVVESIVKILESIGGI